MATHPRDGKQLYHLTKLSNLDGIVDHGLLSRAEVRRRGLSFQDVADAEILAGRARAGLDEWVPFHFFPKNPFDYGVKNAHPGEPFIVITVHRNTAVAGGWSVIPRHPLAGSLQPTILAWHPGVAAIDWDRMAPEGRDYADQECKLVCMAEAICRTRVPPEQISSIYVNDQQTQAQVAATIRGRISPHVNVAGWAV